MSIRRVSLAVVGAIVASVSLLGQISALGPLRVRVTLDPGLGATPASGRLIVFMTNKPEPVRTIQPPLGDDVDHVWLVSTEVRNLLPGQSIELDGDTIGAPQPLSRAPQGDYQLMALLDVDHNATYGAITAGDLRSAVASVKALAPSQTLPIELRLTERVSEPPVTLPQSENLVDFVSRSLSRFWGRSIHMRAIVVLPPGYEPSKRRYPTVYYTHGFGEDLRDLAKSKFAQDLAVGKLPPMIWVLLDQTCPGGTHEFVDSVNNGPWGTARTTELIPELERRYRMDGRVRGRFLTGHSSGGWATMWLQVTYPDVFGGTWSTSPDPIDFREFVNIDLTKDDNVYKRSNGRPTPLVRMGGRDVESFEQFARIEAVLGDYGGQLASFEWVFSARGTDGRPMPLFNRASGQIYREVADYWLDHFDTSRILTTNANQLVSRLRGKIHIIVGTADTFYLDRPVRLLEETIAPLGYDAKFTYLRGRTHFDLFKGELMTRIATQMYDLARPGHKWKPTIPPDPATELAR